MWDIVINFWQKETHTLHYKYFIFTVEKCIYLMTNFQNERKSMVLSYSLTWLPVISGELDIMYICSSGNTAEVNASFEWLTSMADYWALFSKIAEYGLSSTLMS